MNGIDRVVPSSQQPGPGESEGTTKKEAAGASGALDDDDEGAE